MIGKKEAEDKEVELEEVRNQDCLCQYSCKAELLSQMGKR